MKNDLSTITNEIYQLLEQGNAIQPGSPQHDALKKAIMFPAKKVSKNKSKKPVLSEEAETALPGWIDQYNEIFPEKTKIPTSGLYARSAPREVIDGMRWFMLNNPQYSMEIILRATEIYVNEYRLKDPPWSYMQTSQYFARKQNQDKTYRSNLANYCQQALDGEGGGFMGSEPAFKTKVV